MRTSRRKSQRSSVRFAAALLAASLVGVAACAPENSAGTRDAGPGDAAEDRPAVNQCSTAPPSTVTGDAGDPTFEKPERGRWTGREYLEEPPDDGRPVSREVRLWSRPYMPEPSGKHTVWLEVGEHFTLDGVISVSGSEAPGEFQARAVVFVDFERVPFAIVPVGRPDGWPTRDEFSTLQFEEVQRFGVTRGEPRNFTLVVPPDSLDEKGAHDLRIVFLAPYQPFPDVSIVAPRAFLGNIGYRVFYGGYETVAPADESFPSIERIHPGETFGAHLVFGHGRLLYPRARRAKLASTDESKEMRLGGVFETADDSIRLEAIAAGSSEFNYAGTNYYLVIDGADPVGGLAGTGTVGSIPEDPGAADGTYANRFPVPLQLDDTYRHAIRVLSFPEPNCTWLEAGSDPPVDGRISNIIYVRRSQ